MSTIKDGIRWVEPFILRDVTDAKASKTIAAELKRQLSERLAADGIDKTCWTRCVYVIRMKGDYAISYPKGHSPVLYVGSGFAFGRISSHLKNWLFEAKNFGRDVAVEIRVCRPRRKGRANLYKCVEADLISKFEERFGCIPFFNSRRETSHTEYVDYTDSQETDLRSAIGIGKGNRPKWAIFPLSSNKKYDVYWRGHSEID